MKGEYKSTLDAKGRMNFPAKLREELGDSFVIAKALDAHCIRIYSNEDWERMVAKIRALPQTKTADIQRFLFGSAFDVEVDKQGRASVPQPLRNYAGLQTDVVIIGLEGVSEIWDKQAWDEKQSSPDMEALLKAAMEMEL